MKKKYIYISIIFIINVLIFYKATNAFFVADDFFYIFNRNNWSYYSPLTNFFFQPITLIVYYINYFWAGLNPYNYHLFTILLNAVITCIIFYMILLLTKRSLYAFLGTIILSVHYVPADNMIWINCTNNVICGLFYFISIIYSIKYNKLQKKRYFIGMLLFLNLAFYTREMGVSLFLILLLIDILFYRNKGNRFIIKKNIYIFFFFIIYIVVMLIGPTLRTGRLTFSRGNYNMYLNIYWMIVNLNWFFFKLFIPFSFGSHMRVDLLHEIILFIRFNYIILIAIFILAFIIRNRYYYFGVLWIFFTSSPYLLLSREMVFNGERYFYLPRVGFVFILISFWIFIKKNIHKKLLFNVLKIIVVVFIIFYSSFSIYAINKRIGWWISAGEISKSFFEGFEEHFEDIPENTVFFIKDLPRWSTAPNKLIVLINGAPYGLKLFYNRQNIEVIPYWADDMNETYRRLQVLSNTFENKYFFQFTNDKLIPWTPDVEYLKQIDL